MDGQPHLYSEAQEAILDELEEAASIAAECDLIIMVSGDNTVTGCEDRDHCELGKPLVPVLENGRPLELSRETEVCDAILMIFFGLSYTSFAYSNLTVTKTGEFRICK